MVTVVLNVDAVNCPPLWGQSASLPGSPRPKPPAPWAGTVLDTQTPAYPAQALAMPRATQSLLRGSLSRSRVGILEEDQVGKCRAPWSATAGCAASGTAVPTPIVWRRVLAAEYLL